MSIVSLLKKLPIDVGQAEKKHDSEGKVIASSFICDGYGKKALDIGCRDGYWAKKLEARGYIVSALDLEPQFQFALKHNVENGLPYNQNTFDLVWCTELIEHLYKPDFLVKEISRVLKSDGIAIITTPNSNWWLYKVSRLWGWTPKKLQNPDHKQFFHYKDIKRLFPKSSVYGFFPYALFKLRVRNAIMVSWFSPTFVVIAKRGEL